MHRMSLVGLVLGCSPEVENSDLKFRLSLRKRETFKTHVKEASQLDFSFCSTHLAASISASYCCGQQAGHKYLGQCLWPQEFKEEKEEISNSISFGILASRLDEVGELSQLQWRKGELVKNPFSEYHFTELCRQPSGRGSLYSDSW